MDWRIYLLPAGESEYLGNVVKSMTVEPFLPAQSISDRLNGRAMPFIGWKVLLITSKRKDEKARNYQFLLCALGAQVYGCSSIEEAHEFLSQGDVALIFADQEDVKRRKEKLGVKIRPLEIIVQGLILGAFPEDDDA